MNKLRRCEELYKARARGNSAYLAVGQGTSIAHHGELFQGQIRAEDGRLRYCLMSLPCNELCSTVTFIPDLTGEYQVEPTYKEKVKRAVQVTLSHFQVTHLGGVIRVDSNIREGKGYGSSTADCVAGAIAAAAAIDCRLSEAKLAELVVRAEIASDNIMFKHAVLFAHREGTVVEDYACPTPKIEVLGFDTNEAECVNTLEYSPPAYELRHLQDFHGLKPILARAIRTQDIHLLAQVATASATINEEFLQKPMFKEISSVVDYVGGLGVAAAHSGTILSVLLDPQDPILERRIEVLQKELSALGTFQFFRFQT